MTSTNTWFPERAVDFATITWFAKRDVHFAVDFATGTVAAKIISPTTGLEYQVLGPVCLYLGASRLPERFFENLQRELRSVVNLWYIRMPLDLEAVLVGPVVQGGPHPGCRRGHTQTHRCRMRCGHDLCGSCVDVDPREDPIDRCQECGTMLPVCAPEHPWSRLRLANDIMRVLESILDCRMRSWGWLDYVVLGDN